jgi:hypothetical protein
MLLQKGWDGGVEVCATECVVRECNEGGLETNCGRMRMRDKEKGPGDTKSHERLGIEHDFPRGDAADPVCKRVSSSQCECISRVILCRLSSRRLRCLGKLGARLYALLEASEGAEVRQEEGPYRAGRRVYDKPVVPGTTPRRGDVARRVAGLGQRICFMCVKSPLMIQLPC